MITEIPSAEDFLQAGLNQLYLAWRIAMRTIQDYDEVQKLAYDMAEDDAAKAASTYWSKSQPALANAFGLIQQAMEMALKGRIAAISPYLLIARDPKEWPRGADKQAVPFSEFRTLDAADLVKVHNTFAASPLDDRFRAFWDGVRRDRNKLMHSVSNQPFDPALLICSILTAVEALYSDVSWPKRLLSMEAEDIYSSYGLEVDYSRNIVLTQTDIAVRYLTPADRKRFLNFDSRRRAYVCPLCWSMANHDWQEDWPALAQLASKRPGETSLQCIVCEIEPVVERIACINPDCEGDVIYEEICLTCLWKQDSPYNFPSGLQDGNLSIFNEYVFGFVGRGRSTSDRGRFKDDASAIEHARRAMHAPHLQGWLSVAINRWAIMGQRENVGTWIRNETGLVWDPTNTGAEGQPASEV